MRVNVIIEDINKKESDNKYVTSRNCFTFVYELSVYGTSVLTDCKWSLLIMCEFRRVIEILRIAAASTNQTLSEPIVQ